MTTCSFYRLLGDATGDGFVDDQDLAAIGAAMGRRGTGLEQDINADAVVDFRDRALAFAARGRQLGADLVLTEASSSLIDGTLVGNSYAVGTGDISAPVTGPSGLTKTGDGTMVLSAANSYTGGTTVDAGTLTFATAVALPAGSNLSVGAGGVVAFSSGFTGPIAAAEPEAVPGGMAPAASTISEPVGVPVPATTVAVASPNDSPTSHQDITLSAGPSAGEDSRFRLPSGTLIATPDPARQAGPTGAGAPHAESYGYARAASRGQYPRPRCCAPNGQRDTRRDRAALGSTLLIRQPAVAQAPRYSRQGRGQRPGRLHALGSADAQVGHRGRLRVGAHQFRPAPLAGPVIVWSVMAGSSSSMTVCSFLIARIQSICTAGRERSMRSATSLKGSRWRFRSTITSW